MSDRAAERRAPQAFAEAGTDDLDVGQRRQQAREEIGAARRVVREVEGEDRDLHAAVSRA